MTSASNSSRREALTVLAVPAFRDNYIWLIRRGSFAVAVDPGDAEPVEAALGSHRLTLAAIVLTHHHRDHVGGVEALAARRRGLPVYGPRPGSAGGSIAGLTRSVGESDVIEPGSEDAAKNEIALEFSTFEIPGHTLDHVAYFGLADGHPILFCGDTLFAAGCGRLFEGTAGQMHRSLSRLAALPPETQIYCGHEYTLANLEFAAAVEPGSAAIHARLDQVRALRERGDVSLPSSIALELQTNPFLRCDQPGVRAAAEAIEPGAGASPTSTFAAIRAWKDRFRTS